MNHSEPDSRRTALVVGGAGGIGAAVCRRLADDGLLVVVADRDVEGASAVRDTLNGEGHFTQEVDVTDESSVDSALDEVESRSPFAVLVVVAGGPVATAGQSNALVDMSLALWNQTWSLNVTGTFLCARKFAQQRHVRPLSLGRIVTFSSITSQRGGGRLGPAYPSAKAAVSGLTRHLALELADEGITANAVVPGSVDTADFRRFVDDASAERVAAAIPVGRVGHPEEVAEAVSFLVSPGGSFVTGTTLDVNGGAVMR